MHKIAEYIFGATGGIIDRVSVWTAVSSISTFVLLILAFFQLRSINKTARTDFLHRFTLSFFNQDGRTFLMLLKYNLLKFGSRKLPTNNTLDSNGEQENEIAYFELDEQLLAQITEIDTKEKNNLKKFYSSYEVDDAV